MYKLKILVTEQTDTIYDCKRCAKNQPPFIFLEEYLKTKNHGRVDLREGERQISQGIYTKYSIMLHT